VAQLAHVSPAKQNPSPQRPHTPQSTPHETHSSRGCVHVMSGVHMHAPQSLGQVPQFSSALGRQMPSPQYAHVPQSAGQL
jgi:hypothetical protein